MNNFNFKLIYKKHKNIDWILPAIVWSLLFGFLVMLFSGYLLGYRVY